MISHIAHDCNHSYVTLFELMVVNNWHVIMNGFVAVTSEWSRLFFMLFYLVTVVRGYNIVTLLTPMNCKAPERDTFVHSLSPSHIMCPVAT